MKEKITFKHLSFSDIPLVHRWFNMPHVQAFYSLRSWSENEVFNKLKPYITGENPVFGFIISLDDLPIGYVQYYRLADFPWPEQALFDEVIRHAAGIDLFIGDPDYLGKGYGTRILNQILTQLIWPQFDYCIVDPDIRNNAMIRCSEKLGFKQHKIINTEDALKRTVKLMLMILKK